MQAERAEERCPGTFRPSIQSSVKVLLPNEWKNHPLLPLAFFRSAHLLEARELCRQVLATFKDVVRALTAITYECGVPRTIKSDNGSEFISKVMDKWAYEGGVELDFSRPGKPTDNASVESFNGRLRQECLNASWFMSLDDARGKIEAWRQYYDESSPHSCGQAALAPCECRCPTAADAWQTNGAACEQIPACRCLSAVRPS